MRKEGSRTAKSFKDLGHEGELKDGYCPKERHVRNCRGDCSNPESKEIKELGGGTCGVNPDIR